MENLRCVAAGHTNGGQCTSTTCASAREDIVKYGAFIRDKLSALQVPENYILCDADIICSRKAFRRGKATIQAVLRKKSTNEEANPESVRVTVWLVYSQSPGQLVSGTIQGDVRLDLTATKRPVPEVIRMPKESALRYASRTGICYICSRTHWVRLGPADKRQPPKRCSLCQKVAYCSYECQETHWPSHKNVCHVLRGQGDVILCLQEDA